MKKTFTTILLLCMFFSARSQSSCRAFELTGIRNQTDNNCASNSSNPNIAELSAVRNFVKTGIFVWSFRANSGQPFQNIPSGWIPSSGFDVISEFSVSTSDNGEYRVIFIEAGTGCSDTAFTTVFVNTAPAVDIFTTNICNGVQLVANDNNNPSGTGNTYEWNQSGTSDPSTIIYTGPGGMGSGQYVLVTNSLGCTGEDFTGSLFPQPGVYTLTATKRKILAGQQSKLTATSNYPVAFYKWFKNGVMIPGAAGNQYTVLWPDTGNYRVRMQHTVAAGNCNINKFITISKKVVIRESDGITYDAQLTAYPNPASDKIFIGGHEEIIEIYTMNGALVLRETISAPVAELSIAGLENGLYILRSGEQYTKISINH